MIHFGLNADGSFDVLKGDRVLVLRAFAQVTYHDPERGEQTVCTTQREGQTLRGADENLELIWRCEADVAWLELCNHGKQPVHIHDLRVLWSDAQQGSRTDLGPVSELLYLQHGWQSWSPVRVRYIGDAASSFQGDDYAEKHEPHGALALGQSASEWFTLVKHIQENDALLLGFITAADQLAEIRMSMTADEVQHLGAICYGDGARLLPSETLRSEKLWISSGTPSELFEAYASRLGHEMKARTNMPPLSGWCTWYFYFGENDESDLRANIEFARNERLALDLILIDDGYQTAVGDWTSIRADKFPRGMAAAADEIRRVGMLPGIWLAPFGARHDSDLAARHPEYLLRDASGQPVRMWRHWEELIYALDLTHPAVLDHLRGLFRTVCHEWGFDLVKLDFIYAGAASGIHYDPSATRAQAFRRGLQAIREGVGEGKWILGCGAPQAASVGLVDAMRIGQDVSIGWKPIDLNPSSPAVSHAIQNSIMRAPFHRKLWVNDPDCVILRTRGNASILTQSEVRTLMTVIALTGSIVLDGDNLSRVSGARLDDFRRVLPPLEKAARANNIFANGPSLPEALELQLEREWGEWCVLAAINWQARARGTELKLPDAREYHVYDFWQKKYLGPHHGRVAIDKIAPHGTAVLIVAPVTQEANLIASTFHISGGYAEVESIQRNPNSLKIEMQKAGRQRGELIFAIPENGNVRAMVNGRHTMLHKLAQNVCAVRFVLDERATVDLRLE